MNGYKIVLLKAIFMLYRLPECERVCSGICKKLIVEQLKNGNEDAYKYIYDYHYVLLCHVANQYLNDNFLSETIVGDVIFHLWEIRETLNITISIRSYLIKAVRNRWEYY